MDSAQKRAVCKLEPACRCAGDLADGCQHDARLDPSRETRSQLAAARHGQHKQRSERGECQDRDVNE
eukprot:3894076-Rhodomonas_salina.1